MSESGASSAAISALVEKEVFILSRQEESRLAQEDDAVPDTYQLSAQQEAAWQNTTELLNSKDTVLLHGVTASGKTLLYIRLIEECLEKGKQALYLLPEIAITEQMTRRLNAYFGNQLAVYHSRFNDNERGEIWKNVLQGTC